jgi:hypothetical protein
MEHRRRYAAYLLRLWQVQSESKTTCRASLESAHTGERVGFASLEELFTFLEQEVCQVAQKQTAAGTGGKHGDEGA